ncbi:uncharacterized protein LOC131238785 [Magnolia sinica]|uniref:uncharacterized protein LOC131238785 n=1 Tax=Magnolia sinica TaxID=86752 RepID=UPI0026598BCD|nr:uncharacterized protein LOC131238785 [Magnolia sinica]
MDGKRPRSTVSSHIATDAISTQSASPTIWVAGNPGPPAGGRRALRQQKVPPPGDKQLTPGDLHDTFPNRINLSPPSKAPQLSLAPPPPYPRQNLLSFPLFPNDILIKSKPPQNPSSSSSSDFSFSPDTDDCVTHHHKLAEQASDLPSSEPFTPQPHHAPPS